MSLMSNKLEQLEFKLEKNIWIQKHAGKVRKKRLIRKVGEQVSAFNTNVVRVELARVCLNFSPLPTEKKNLYFVHPIFGFWFLVNFGAKVKKIQKYYLIFVYILQCKIARQKKNWKKKYTTKVTKIPKTKILKYWMIEM